MATSTDLPPSTEPEPAASEPSAKPQPPAKRPRKATPSARPIEPPVPAGPPPPRRVVFIDVENTSSETDLTRVLDELKIERVGATTELIAIGNWRVVGQGLGRALAGRGAHLLHSAPAVRVSDWSDLWIAVQAGIWLGRANPGDTIEIVSHDRAFDAVGDAAARLGVEFRRITYRPHPGAAAVEREAAAPAPRAAGGQRRPRGGRGRSSAPQRAAAERSRAPARVVPPAPAAVQPQLPEPADDALDGAERHSASQDQIQVAIARLAGDDPAAGVSLDRLTVALKAAGFQRPPGSPRLVTRLRRMKDLEVLPNGRVRLVDATAVLASAEPASDAAAHPGDVDGNRTDVDGNRAEQPPGAAPHKRRSRRRGGRRRNAPGRQAETAKPPS